MGIGENGHLAFNDPPVADFNDPQLVKIVELDEKCRRQQVHDGCFPEIEAVPAHAITLTIPALVGARHISCCVPGTRKANAVHDTLLGPITRECPASILRRHANAVLHIDPASATHLEE
ncbi:glucosamine/galactosamine-6-phosphate isomerase [Chthoniobacter flavus Ellin428]|uniref:Glucosamine/galactosamine-6-phosphate isomerase n=2 Tax=Chthoniobacter flavus TaxID=191863 RepID=B4D2P9_9BACT|nr:6-phosphogluconolactonase [Chthoniobacter flavus]EDY19489.1 glucosamine/galactosamine-6-phosphate isomerase [Chthoniobacter flavus Ellin428]